MFLISLSPPLFLKEPITTFLELSLMTVRILATDFLSILILANLATAVPETLVNLMF